MPSKSKPTTADIGAEIANLIADLQVQEARLRGVLVTGGDTAGARAAIRERKERLAALESAMAEAAARLARDEELLAEHRAAELVAKIEAGIAALNARFAPPPHPIQP